MYSTAELVNIDANISQDIRSPMDKERPWSPLLIKGAGMTVLECLQGLFFFEAKNTLGIWGKKIEVFTLD